MSFANSFFFVIYFSILSLSSTDILIGFKNRSSISFELVVFVNLNSISSNSLESFYNSNRLFIPFKILFFVYCLMIPSHCVCTYSFDVSNDSAFYIMKKMIQKVLEKNHHNSLKCISDYYYFPVNFG